VTPRLVQLLQALLLPLVLLLLLAIYATALALTKETITAIKKKLLGFAEVLG